MEKRRSRYVQWGCFLISISISIFYLGDCWAGSLAHTGNEAKPQPKMANGSPISIDMNGDGNQDEFSIVSADGESWRMMVKLANGGIIYRALNGVVPPEILGMADIAADGRQQIIIRTGGETWSQVLL